MGPSTPELEGWWIGERRLGNETEVLLAQSLSNTAMKTVTKMTANRLIGL